VAWCLDAFAAADTVARAVIAAPPGHEAEITALAPEGLEAEVVAGGSSRPESVAAALALAETDVVTVHDAARPLVTAELIDALAATLGRSPDAAGVIAATPITDTVKRVDDDGTIARTEDRRRLWAAQTPQVFWAEALREAHASDPGRRAAATDDAILIERMGRTVMIEPAPPTNLKVTTAADLTLAELLLRSRG
jgi:2-C-methyl-D-erythritol 4-phosphate cytidylyltransferase